MSIDKQLLLVRHAVAANAATDLDRGLTAYGQQQASDLGAWLVEIEFKPQRMLVSHARRARETAQAIIHRLAYPHDQVKTEPLLYNASAGDYVQLLDKAFAMDSTVMIVAHNPGISNIARMLLGPSASAHIKPATLIWISLSGESNDWQQATATLLTRIDPYSSESR